MKKFPDYSSPKYKAVMQEIEIAAMRAKMATPYNRELQDMIVDRDSKLSAAPTYKKGS